MTEPEKLKGRFDAWAQVANVDGQKVLCMTYGDIPILHGTKPLFHTDDMKAVHVLVEFREISDEEFKRLQQQG